MRRKPLVGVRVVMLVTDQIRRVFAAEVEEVDSLFRPVLVVSMALKSAVTHLKKPIAGGRSGLRSAEVHPNQFRIVLQQLKIQICGFVGDSILLLAIAI